MGSPLALRRYLRCSRRSLHRTASVARRLFAVVCEHYFDDYMAVEPEFSLRVGMVCFLHTITHIKYR